MVCYWGSWSYYRPAPGKFSAEDANPNLCTHMIYGVAKLNADNTIGIFDVGLDPDTNGALGLLISMARQKLPDTFTRNV